jgi:biopolymer transport protein ExbD
MAFSQTQERHGTLAEINITPLIDVMLVLLVIFMIAAPVLTRDIPLTLPQVAPPSPIVPPPPIELRIDALGEVTVAGGPVAMSELASVLRTERERMAGQKVVLSVEASYDVDYEVVAKVLAKAQNAGLTSIRMK